MKVTSNNTGRTRPVVSLDSAFFTCLRVEEDNLYGHPDFPTIQVLRVEAEIHYEIGDEVVIVKDWSGYASSIWNSADTLVGQTGKVIALHNSNTQKNYVRLEIPDCLHSWWYETTDVVPHVAGEPTKTAVKKKYRVINPA